MREAKIQCPHCGSSITVRQASAGDIKPENVEKIWAASDSMFREMDAMFKKMDEGFRRIFNPKLWR